MLWECKYCKKELELKSKYTKSGHQAKCSKWKEWRDLNLTKEILEKLYIDKSMSLPEIKNYFELNSVSTIHKKLKEFCLNIRTVEESINLDKIKLKKRKNSIRKSGFPHSFCKEHPSRKKWEKRLLDEEGITNVFQRPEVKEKTRKTILKKYGVEDPNKIPIRGPKTYSKLHKNIVEFLQDKNVPIKIEFKIPSENKVNQWYLSFDIIIENTNKLIEVYGDYWHGNPIMYKPNDIILKNTSREMFVKDKWQLDRKKNNIAIEKGYNILIVWEYDWNNSPNIKREILEWINEKNKN